MAARKQQLEEAFTVLETQKTIIEKCTLHWKELSDHYASLEQTLDKKDQELAEKEKSLELKCKEAEALLEKREQSLDEKEQKLITRVGEQKKCAVEAIEKGKSDGELKFLCQKMDAEGVWKYLTENKKDIQTFRAELPPALESAIDPARLVLEAIESFYDKNSENNSSKKQPALADQRRACSLLLESLVPVLADPILGEDHPVVAQVFKERAKAIADDWKSKIDVDGDLANAKTLEVQAFLQLLATFGIAAEFDRGDLRKLVLAVSWRKQIAKLCGPLRLSEIMPDIVEELINKGKEIEAVYFAYSSGLSEKFPPVPLLKTYLKNSKKGFSGNNSVAANEANSKELNALRAVIKCIEELNLQTDFPPDSLQNRVVELEKKRSERKKTGVAVKSQNKRPRSSGGGSGARFPQAKSGRFPKTYASANASDRSFYHRSAVSAGGVAAYNFTGQSTYDRSSQPVYGSSYGVSRSPVSLSKTYAYPSDDMGTSLRGSGSYNATANYGNYNFGSSVPPVYQSSYLQ
ncbi:hypothetical protein SUGI_0311830 [Cryptomeria japonica]|nr:hypothetical protein SUGI_0311830 [Cryptomeria japonica]